MQKEKGNYLNFWVSREFDGERFKTSLKRQIPSAVIFVKGTDIKTGRVLGASSEPLAKSTFLEITLGDGFLSGKLFSSGTCQSRT